MFELSPDMKLSIFKNTGLKVDQISKMSFKEIDEHLGFKSGKKFPFIIPEDLRLIGRGSVYLFLRRTVQPKGDYPNSSKVSLKLDTKVFMK